MGQLNKISFYEKKQDNQYRLHMLPLEGKDRRKYLGFDIFVSCFYKKIQSFKFTYITLRGGQY